MSENPCESEVIWYHCNECGRETKHNVLYQINRCTPAGIYECSYYPEEGTKWKLLQCRGCEEVFLQRIDWFSEDIPANSSEPTCFPPRVSRKKPRWMWRLGVPSEYTDLLNETYVALHANSRRLATMGARALVDAVIRRNVGDQGNFEKGLDTLVKKELISKRNSEIIYAAVEAGNASAHRGYCPSSDDVNTVIDIVENLIHNELLAASAQALKSSTPKRQFSGRTQEHKVKQQ